jgi:hypothetical protein
LLEVDLNTCSASPGSPSKAKARLSAYPLGSPSKSLADLEQKLRAATERRQQQLKRKATSPAKKYTAMVTAKRALNDQVKKQELANEGIKVELAEAKRAKSQEERAKKAGDAYKHALKVCADQKLIMAEATKTKQLAIQQKLESATARHEQALAQKKKAAERFARLNLETFQTKQKEQAEDLSKKLEDKLSAASLRHTEQKTQRLAFNQLRNSRAEVVIECRAKLSASSLVEQNALEERQQRADAIRSLHMNKVVAKAAEQNGAAKETTEDVRKQREQESQHLQEFMSEKQSKAAARRQLVIDAKKAKAVETASPSKKRGSTSGFNSESQLEATDTSTTTVAATPPAPPITTAATLATLAEVLELEVVGASMVMTTSAIVEDGKTL